MHVLLIVAIVVVCVGAGYGFRGLLHRDLVASKAEIAVFSTRLQSAAASDLQTLRTVVAGVVEDIRKKL
jgi:hypothetical protein